MKKEFLFFINHLTFFLLPLARWMGRIRSSLISKAALDILVIRPGGMGDLVMATEALKNFENEPSIFWLIEKRSAQWAEHLGLRFVCYDDPAQWKKLSGLKFKTILNLEQRYSLSQTPAEFLKDNEGKCFGFNTNEAARFFDGAVFYEHDQQESHEFAKIFAKAFKAKSNPLPTTSKNSGSMVVGLSGGEVEARQLSTTTWVSFIRSQLGQKNFTLIYGPAEEKLAKELSELFKGQCQFQTRSFAESVAVIQKAEKFYSLDGGLVHIASYYRIPSILLFTNGNYRKWSPLAEHSQILRRKDLPCQPCVIFGRTPPCPHQWECKRLDKVIAENQL